MFIYRRTAPNRHRAQEISGFGVRRFHEEPVSSERRRLSAGTLSKNVLLNSTALKGQLSHFVGGLLSGFCFSSADFCRFWAEVVGTAISGSGGIPGIFFACILSQQLRSTLPDF